MALALLDDLSQLVTDLEALKAAEAAHVADRDWVDQKWAAKQADINSAEAIKAVDRATAETRAAYHFARYERLAPAIRLPDYPSARAAWPPFDTAVDELNAMQAVYDGLKAKRDAVVAAQQAIQADVNTASSMRAVTPEFKALIDTFHTQAALYYKAYNAQDWDAALAQVPAFVAPPKRWLTKRPTTMRRISSRRARLTPLKQRSPHFPKRSSRAKRPRRKSSS